MRRVLFLPLITRGSAIGTISRCLSIAEKVRERGGQAFFLTNTGAKEHVSAAGFELMEGAVPEPVRDFHPVHDLSDVAVLLNLAEESYIRDALEHERAAVERFKPDALFSEFKLTAPLTAATCGLPLISTACSPADPRFTSPLYPHEKALDHAKSLAGFNRVLDECRLAPITDVAELFFTRSTMKIAPTSPELEPLLADVPDLHYVGYLLYDRWETAPLGKGMECPRDAQCVFVYFSMGEIGPELYTRVLPAAFDGTEFHAIVATGDHPDLPRLPEPTANVTYFRFVPGRSILARCKAFIFHGGQNSAMASLIHGIPSIMIPGGDFERDFNARRVASLGAGIHLRIEDFTPERIIDSLRTVVSPLYRRAAETQGQRLLDLGGPDHAAELILDERGE